MKKLRYYIPVVWQRCASFISSSCLCPERRQLSVVFLAFLVSSVLLQYGAFCPGFAKEGKRCHMCGMDAAKSQTEFVVSLDNGSQEHACCLHCVYLLQKFMKDRRMVRIETRDFSTGALIEAKQAFYLEGASLIPKGSMAPFLLAFLQKESAEKYRVKHGGNVVNFNRALEIVADFDNKVAPVK